MKLSNFLFKLTVLILLASSARAQVTTSSLTGIVRDNGGEGMIGATVKATHVPSGTVYGVVTQDDGRYNIPNMRVGGPYSIEASFIGYAAEPQNDIYLALGQKLSLDFDMKEAGVVGQEVVIVGVLDPVLNGERTGAATSIDRTLLDRLPTISRSAADYTRLNTMSAEGGSFAGRNDQFNNYSLDGTIFNNPFGLDAATPGGQTNAQPISLDAIEQINVSIAPYDVTQSGFTGAAINAVTKSGTNDFSGTVYGFFRNAGMTGGKVDGEDIFKGDLQQLQTGFSIGGPIAKNKAFFFANFELENRSDLGSFFVPNSGSSGSNVSRVLLSDMQAISQVLKTQYGYDTGDAQNFKHDSDNKKGIIKLDFNLSDNHKLTASYNFLDAFRDLPAHPSAIGRRGPDFLTLQFQNSGYRIVNKIHSGIAELKSLFGNRISNKLQIGYTSFRDHREPFSQPFPVINIGKGGVRYIVAGHEPFSINNVLDQDVFQVRNDLNLFAGKHTWTFGTSFERFNFNNSFNLTGYGSRVFFPDIPIEDAVSVLSSPDFAAEVKAARDAFSSNNANDSWALAETNLGQWSLYGQDEIQMSDRFTLTLGLRIDMPLYFNTPELIQENIDRNCCYDPSIIYSDENGQNITFNHTDLPDQKPLFNPRIGFNYDMKGDRSVQLRGGTGFFSGRFPFVWIGNQVANPNFFFYNMTAKNFKFPQIWRTNFGYDRKLGSGWLTTFDVVYTKDLQSHIVRNYGLKLPGGKLEGIDKRPIYRNQDRVLVFGAPTNAYVFTNAQSGSSLNISLEISRSWANNYFKFGYNYLNAKDVASIDAEISSDAYDRNPANINHTNDPELAPSLYGNRHRVIGAASRKFNWSNPKLSTTVSLFFEYAEGNRYSYTYSGDINNDGSGLNDLLYIPTDSEIDQMSFSGTNAAAQRSAFKAYIAQDSYLSSRRGEYAEKYGSLSPWYNTWDLRILQDFSIGGDQKFQFSVDVLNIGNMISSGWGVRKFATQTALAQPLAVSVANGVPSYTFDTAQTTTFFNDFSLRSRWQLQLGLRYIF